MSAGPDQGPTGVGPKNDFIFFFKIVYTGCCFYYVLSILGLRLWVLVSWSRCGKIGDVVWRAEPIAWMSVFESVGRWAA